MEDDQHWLLDAGFHTVVKPPSFKWPLIVLHMCYLLHSAEWGSGLDCYCGLQLCSLMILRMITYSN